MRRNVADAVQSVGSIVDVSRSGGSVTSSARVLLGLWHEEVTGSWGEARE